ncbi:MAG: biotin/lipoyl-containing protein, partial [Chthoniobacterales bacterium]
MSLEVKIPAVGESITSGVVSVWHKKSGEQVRAGEPLFTLETDKVSTEIVAEKSGVLKTLAAEGQEVKIGEVVATIDESGAVATSEKAKEKPKSSETKSPNAEVLPPSVRRIVEEEKLDAAAITGTGKGGRLTKSDAVAAAQNRTVGGAVSVPGKPAASPTKEEIAESSNGRYTR